MQATPRSRVQRLESVKTLVAALPARPGCDPADAGAWVRAAEWALRYEPAPSPDVATLVDRALDRAEHRCAQLAAGRAPWLERPGRRVHGYRSRIDGSYQGYGVVVPRGWRRDRPIRCDIVLHGSLRPVPSAELRLLAPFDRDDDLEAPAVPYVELHPMGRVENAYRWAGETDVEEALDDLCRKMAIDRDRIVLRGMSMGASGTWHLGLKRPDRYVALGPYCGYVDTHRFSETPGMDFVRVGPLPAVQEDGLHLLDSVDWCANAREVPVVAAIGEVDPFREAHRIMARAFRDEGLEMVEIESKGTGHVQDPATWAEQMRRIAVHARPGLDRDAPRVRATTWSLRYARFRWWEFQGLERQCERADVDAACGDDGVLTVRRLTNTTAFRIHRPIRALVIDGARVPVMEPDSGGEPALFVRSRGAWRQVTGMEERRFQRQGKRPGLQGPIDDAFRDAFTVVRGTGRPWNPAVHAAALAAMERFVFAFARWFRGDPRVVDDRAVTPEMARGTHLVCFGDPGSNAWIARAARPGAGPMRWDRGSIRSGRRSWLSGAHLPMWIAPAPWTDGRYVVVNSGHTFGAAELDRLNYLLFPRKGDWAVSNVESGSLVEAGWFDEAWRGPRDGR